MNKKKFFIIGGLLLSFLIGMSISSNSGTPTPTPSTVAPETPSPFPTSIPTPTPTIQVTPTPIPIPTPTPTPDYLSRLTKCFKDMANDPINQEIKKDNEMLNNINSSNCQSPSNPLECSLQLSRERAAIVVRLSANTLSLSLKYLCLQSLPSHTSDDFEKAWLIKDINSGDSVIIERRNGEQWLLKAKTWCSWCWRNEGRQTLLKFGYTTSKLINDNGDVSEFWTEKEL